MKHKFKMTKRRRENFYGYMFVSIWLVGFLVFTCYPIIRTFILSFYKVTITSRGIKTTSVQLGNYKNAFFGDAEFVGVLGQYIGEVILYIPIIIVFSLVIALILNMKIKGKGILRTLFFLPVIIVSGPVMKELIDSGATTIPGIMEIQIVKQGMAALSGIPGGSAIAAIFTTLITSFVMILWYSGVQILIFLSALQKIDRPVYEAAFIDGASRWESFWKITLPNLRSIIVINMVYTIVFISTFSQNNVIVLIQKYSFEANKGLGYASALSFIYFAVLLVVLGIFVKIYGIRSKTDKNEARLLAKMRKKGR